ncbi:choice-of-anchor A family protein [Demequina oxidasica]|uniref:choice-of-anchor A family protein n=1 Tax=Demequina oxidasica TaxID=676199 RepID=UPI0007831512|nr:choice-of-anchor A family protein [Demequina oxidasica]
MANPTRTGVTSVTRVTALVAAAGLALVGVATAAGAVLPDDVPLPGDDGILPGGNPVGGNWGVCEPPAGDTCDDNTWGLADSYPSFQGTDNAANVIVGGNFDAIPGSSETEGLLVVAGDSTFENGGSYSIGFVGGGSFVTPADRADMYVAQGDVTVPSGQNVAVGGSLDAENRFGTVRTGGARNFQDPTGSPSPTWGALGSVDSAADQSTLQFFQNPLYEMGTSFDVFDPLLGDGGLMNVYSQLCYAELATDAPGVAVNASGDQLSVARGTVSVDAQSSTMTLTGDGVADIQTFDMSSEDLAALPVASHVEFAGVPATSAVLINLGGATVDVAFQSFEDQVSYQQRLLWNIPDAIEISVGGTAQYPGSWLVGNPASTTTMFGSGFNGRVYTPGDLVHGGDDEGDAGSEFHAYPFTASLGCFADTPDGGDAVVTKTVTGDGADLVPADTLYTLTYTAQATGGAVEDRELELEAGTPAIVENVVLAEETTFTLVGEEEPPAIDGVTWGVPTFTLNGEAVTPGESVTFPAGPLPDQTLAITNVANLDPVPPVTETGDFSISKEIDGEGALSVPSDTLFTVQYSYIDGQGVGQKDTLEVPADGTPVTSPELAVGTVVTLDELSPPTVDGITWGTPEFVDADGAASSTTTVVVGNDTTVAVTLINEANLSPVPSLTPTPSPTPTPAPSPDNGGGALPLTGSDTSGWVTASLLSLIAGGLLLLARNRLRG